MKNEYFASALVPTVTVLNACISEETPAPRRDSFSIGALIILPFSILFLASPSMVKK